MAKSEIKMESERERERKKMERCHTARGGQNKVQTNVIFGANKIK